MPLPTKWNKKIKKPPVGFEIIEPVLEVLENELRDKVKETSSTIRKNEAIWPVHQINYQKTRYVYDMYYTYNRISKDVYQYCIEQKLIDAALIGKWKKPGYERLCSTYVINPMNYKFNTVSICRVPYKDRSKDQLYARDPTTGCMGCASGKNAGPRNIFGNKYGQNLAAIQIAREKYAEQKRQKQLAKEKQEEEQHRQQHQERRKQQNDDDETNDDDDDDDDETDDEGNDDDDDYGPSPAAGIWAGSQKLQQESELLAEDGDGDEGEGATNTNNYSNNNTNHNNDPDGDDETDDDDEEGPAPLPPPTKRVRTDE